MMGMGYLRDGKAMALESEENSRDSDFLFSIPSVDSMVGSKAEKVMGVVSLGFMDSVKGIRWIRLSRFYLRLDSGIGIWEVFGLLDQRRTANLPIIYTPLLPEHQISSVLFIPGNRKYQSQKSVVLSIQENRNIKVQEARRTHIHTTV